MALPPYNDQVILEFSTSNLHLEFLGSQTEIEEIRLRNAERAFHNTKIVNSTLQQLVGIAESLLSTLFRTVATRIDQEALSTGRLSLGVRGSGKIRESCIGINQ